MKGRRESSRRVATALAGAFLAGGWDVPAMGRRAKQSLGDRRRWPTDLAHVVYKQYPTRPADRPRELARFVEACAVFREAYDDPSRPLHVQLWMSAPTAMGTPLPRSVPKPLAIDGVAELAGWLGVTTGHLDWFADRRCLERSVEDERLRHYRRHWVVSPRGRIRLLEAPKRETKDLQRQVLHGILDRLAPPHAPLQARAARHVGKDVVVRFDLESFYAGVTVGRVYGVLRVFGYPEPVAHTLAALATTVAPLDVLRAAPPLARGVGPGEVDRRRRLLSRLAVPHLPQGAPTSPALAELVAFNLDRRLRSLGRRFDLDYSRYVDDFVFSGSRSILRAGRLDRLRTLVRAIVVDEGFRLNDAKTRVMTPASRQTVTGLVVNARVAAPRRDYERLRAVLHEAAVAGVEAANRSGHPDFHAHLLGRIAWVGAGHPARAAKLQRAFAAINW